MTHARPSRSLGSSIRSTRHVATAVLGLVLLGPSASAAPRGGGAALGLEWAFAPSEPATIDRVNDVAFAPSGDVVLCATSVEPGGRSAIRLFELDEASGSVRWESRFEPTVSDRAERIVVDADGNSYLAGSTTPSPPFPDVLVVRHDADGSLAWARSFDELDNNDEGVDVALGPDDSVVVTGHANGLQGANFFTAKLDRDGDVRWIRQLDGGEGSQTDEAVAVGVGPQGEVYVTGTSRGAATGFAPDVVTVKYAADGTPLWTRRFDGTARGHDLPHDLAVDVDGSVVVVGQTEGAHSSSDAFALRYAADGTLEWLDASLGGSGADAARAVVLDQDGDAYVVGTTFSGRGGFDVLVARVGADGRREWRTRWDGGERLGDAGQVIALDGAGHVLVAAASFHAATETDVSTLVLDAARGRVLDVAVHDGASGAHDAPLAITAGPSGVVVGGFAGFPAEDLLALRYELAAP